MNRKLFLKTALIGSAAGLALPTYSWAQNDKGPALDKELVKEFVTKGHGDLPKVKSMLEETPALLNSVQNWGGWDWEDALGGAGHVGNREIALFLLSKGARMTIHVAAMLGELKVVQSLIEAFPYMKEAKGPHNISLFRHAQAGKEPAEKVLAYLESIGVKE